MGGLEYVAVLAAAVTLAQRAPGPGTLNYRRAWVQWGNRLNKSRNWILVFAAIPWLAAQIYYVRPFAEVVCGWLPRTQFLERYVALAGDFAALDRMLPQDAVLYIPDSGRRLPNFYAPRPVVITPLDLHGRGPVYRLTSSLRQMPSPLMPRHLCTADKWYIRTIAQLWKPIVDPAPHLRAGP